MSDTAVVVSGWVGHPHAHLVRLLDSMDARDPGRAFDLVLCANGLDFSLPAPLEARFDAVFVRENTGYNLGAWEHAWRRLPDKRWFLFLQDECTIRTAGWVADFVETFETTPRCGLVGEHLNRAWDRPWTELCGDWPDAARARFYRKTITAWGIDPGERGRHLTTVVQLSSREVLEAAGGYPQAETYQEAIAAEIGFSRRIEEAGYALAQVGRRRHSRIAHPQWPPDDAVSRLRRSIKKRLG